MKKLNLFIAVTLVAVSSIFTSCKKDDTVTNFPIINTFTADKSTVDEAGDTVTISIKVSPGDKNIKNIIILSSKTGGAAYDVALGKNWSGEKTTAGYWDKDGIYTATATFIVPDGGATYTCTAYDTEGNPCTTSVSATVTIGSTVTTTLFSTVSTETTKAIECYLSDEKSGNSCFANATGGLFTVSGAANNMDIIDFIYFNNTGSSQPKTIYSPSAFKALGISATLAGISSVNATIFTKVTSSATYDNITLEDITSLVSSATTTKISNLATGDLVAFKIANSNPSKGGKLGVFKVNSITSGSGSGDNVNISIRLQK